LFEAFRDLLIEVENQGFPVVAAPTDRAAQEGHEHLKKIAHTADECFSHYYLPEPLALVLVGDENIRAAFLSGTAHRDAVIGKVDGDHTATPSRDLGQIVWPVVKEAMSGVLRGAMHELEIRDEREAWVSGIEAVARALKTVERGTLLVEDDYHLRGSIGKTDRAPIISPDVDVREVMDDAIDVIIDKVLESGGNVIFAPGGSLAGRGRIVLFLRGADG
jgi:hypothetical protein